MTLLFEYQINFLSDSRNATKLPFSAFGMTQQGLQHANYSIGNQDAGCIYVGKNLIIGAVSDGCTSGTNLNGLSYNQVGAHLLSHLAVRAARSLILKKHINTEHILNPFQHSLINDLRRIYGILNPWKFEQEYVLKNFLSSTIIIFIITKEKYTVLSCGDGSVFINTHKKDITAFEGQYFANNLYGLQSDNETSAIDLLNSIQCIEDGQTDSLDTLLISTDGFLDTDIEKSSAFKNFFFSRRENIQRSGFVDRKTEFRADFLESIETLKAGKKWPIDDATFILIQRIK